MKVKNYIKLFGVLAVIGMLFLMMIGFGKVQPGKPQTVKKKETEVYVDIVKEKDETKASKKVVQAKSLKTEDGLGREKEQEQEKEKEQEQEKEKEQEQEKEKEQEGKSVGELPPISANYRRFVGFKRYSKEMVKLGCRFFIFAEDSKYLYKINFDDESLEKVNFKELQNGFYSNKSRLITDEPFLNKFIKISEQDYKVNNSEVIMLVPKKLEDMLDNSIIKNMNNFEEIATLSGYYKIVNGRLVLTLDRVVLVNGRSEAVSIVINL